MVERLESEKEYVALAKTGDNAAFGRLYDQYSQPIYRFIAVKVGTKQEAEDLLHEVFLSAWQKLPGFTEQGFPFSSWLYRIARNRVIDHYRTKKTSVSIDDEDSGVEELPGLDSSLNDQVDTQLDIEAVRGAINQLDGEQKEVIEMRFLSDLSPAEIAKIMDKREGTVRIIQFRALKKLKEILGE
jgi:RNA polymerase sigma-70 factor (ECF subfamily)